MTDPIEPKKVKVDNTEVESHSLADQIAFEKYQAGKAAAAKKAIGGMRLIKMVPPGAP